MNIVLTQIKSRCQIDDATGCWNWQGKKVNGDYGYLRFAGREFVVHCVTFSLVGGVVPDGMELDHVCKNRSCCNPAHLEPVTHAENMRRTHKTHCPQGHEYSGGNLYVAPNGRRHCRACVRINGSRYRDRKSATINKEGSL